MEHGAWRDGARRRAKKADFLFSRSQADSDGLHQPVPAKTGPPPALLISGIQVAALGCDSEMPRRPRRAAGEASQGLWGGITLSLSRFSSCVSVALAPRQRAATGDKQEGTGWHKQARESRSEKSERREEFAERQQWERMGGWENGGADIGNKKITPPQ